MTILGIETSCDECAAAVVKDGKLILSNVVHTQIPFHERFQGVVPEIASRMHTEWIDGVVKEALDRASLRVQDIDAVAATAHPGLLGSLLVGLSFAKAFAWARAIPFLGVDHMLAHLYAPHLRYRDEPSEEPVYPFIGLLVSGGHSIICRADDFDDITILGTTIDDAVGEAFDKVAKYYQLGYPGGQVIDSLAQKGRPDAFQFPLPSLHKGDHRYDLSYSGLKTAVINQLHKFYAGPPLKEGEDWTGHQADIAASFQKTAIEILLRGLYRALEDTGIKKVVAGGGVAANSCLRSQLLAREDLQCIFPPLELCGDNGAMIAGLAYQYFARGDKSSLRTTARARVEGFKKLYP